MENQGMRAVQSQSKHNTTATCVSVYLSLLIYIYYVNIHHYVNIHILHCRLSSRATVIGDELLAKIYPSWLK